MEVVRIGGGDAGWDQPDGPSSRRPRGSPSRPRTSPSAPEFPLVLVTWRDAWFDFDEPDPEDARADYLVSTVGFLVRQGPRFVSVAQEVLPDGDGFRAVTHIPIAVVEKITPLQEPGEARAERTGRSVARILARLGAEVAPTTHTKEGCDDDCDTVTVARSAPPSPAEPSGSLAVAPEGRGVRPCPHPCERHIQRRSTRVA